MKRFILAGLALIGFAAGAWADDKKDEPKPADLPVKATLVAKTTSYKLDLGGKTADEFKKALAEAEKAGKVPEPPAVEMTLELKNTSDKDVQVWVGGDPVVLTLELKGPGAVTAKPQVFFPSIFIAPKPVKIEAGKTHSIPVTSLKYGFRNASLMAYWTEPGEYTLTASLKSGISPAPKDSKDTRDGFGVVTFTTEPIKIKVEGK
jgi:hypothetical protein